MLARSQGRHVPSCEWVNRQMMAYLKGGLAPANAAAMRDHILKCEHCDLALREARLMDAELYEGATRLNLPLSPDRSRRIQKNVYRRVRQALVWRHTTYAARQVGTVLFVVIVLGASMLLVIGPWLRYLAAIERPNPALTSVQDETPELPSSAAQKRPMLEEGRENEAPSTVVADGTVAESPYVRPASTPEERVAEVITTVFDGRRDQVRTFFQMSQPLPESAARVWGRFDGCQGILNLTDFRYTATYYTEAFASVYVYYADQYLGDLKVRLGADGDWYLTYFNYASFNMLETICYG